LENVNRSNFNFKCVSVEKLFSHIRLFFLLTTLIPLSPYTFFLFIQEFGAEAKHVATEIANDPSSNVAVKATIESLKNVVLLIAKAAPAAVALAASQQRSSTSSSHSGKSAIEALEKELEDLRRRESSTTSSLANSLSVKGEVTIDGGKKTESVSHIGAEKAQPHLEPLDADAEARQQQLKTLAQLRSLSSSVLRSSTSSSQQGKNQEPVMKTSSKTESIPSITPVVPVEAATPAPSSIKPSMTDLIAQSRSVQLKKASSSLHHPSQQNNNGNNVASGGGGGGKGDLANYMRTALDKRFQSLRKKKPVDSPNSDGGVFSDDCDAVSAPVFSPPPARSTSTLGGGGGNTSSSASFTSASQTAAANFSRRRSKNAKNAVWSSTAVPLPRASMDTTGGAGGAKAPPPPSSTTTLTSSFAADPTAPQTATQAPLSPSLPDRKQSSRSATTTPIKVAETIVDESAIQASSPATFTGDDAWTVDSSEDNSVQDDDEEEEENEDENDINVQADKNELEEDKVESNKNGSNEFAVQSSSTVVQLQRAASLETFNGDDAWSDEEDEENEEEDEDDLVTNVVQFDPAPSQPVQISKFPPAQLPISLLSQIKQQQKPILSSTSQLGSSNSGRRSPIASAGAAPEMKRAVIAAASATSTSSSSSSSSSSSTSITRASSSSSSTTPAPPLSLLSSIQGFDKNKALKKGRSDETDNGKGGGGGGKENNNVVVGKKSAAVFGGTSNNGGNPMALAAAAAKKLKHVGSSNEGGGGVAAKVAAVAIAAKAAVSSSSPSGFGGVLRSAPQQAQGPNHTSSNQQSSSKATFAATPLRKTGRALV
jgi:hypothetical protein